MYPKMAKIYCKRGYFHDTTPISFREAYGFYFCVGVIFMKNARAQKNAKNYPHMKISTLTVAISVKFHETVKLIVY